MKNTNTFFKVRRSDAYLFIKFHHPQTLPSTISTKIWKVLKRRYAAIEKKKLVMSKQRTEELTKYKNTGIANQRSIARNDAT